MRWSATRERLVMDVEVDKVWVSGEEQTKLETDQIKLLDLLTDPAKHLTMSFYELLFQYYPSPQGEDEKKAIMDYLLSNPQQSCWILDGYDEFQENLNEGDNKNAQLDPRSPRPVAELISALLHRHILPGCTVVITCRVRDATDLERKADKVGEIQPWNHHQIKQYVDKYFQLKGNTDFWSHATSLLFSNKHLAAISSIPALCNFSCICLEHLLQEMQPRCEGKEDARLVPQVPSTLTSVYLTSIATFLSRCLNQKEASTKMTSQSTLLPLTSLVSHYRSELSELCELAWNGLETGKTLFLEGEIPFSILDFSVTSGLISQVALEYTNIGKGNLVKVSNSDLLQTELRKNGTLVTAYCFIHLTVQEFLSALKIMTSADDKLLRNRLSLKTRWPNKSGQKTVFTSSIHLFLSGLASTHCSDVLAVLANHKLSKNVKKSKKLAPTNVPQQHDWTKGNNTTVLELCHCIQESQDDQVAKQLTSIKPSLELHNINLSPKDLDALAFVVNSSQEKNIGLDFQACSIELDGLELLSSCKTITDLSFHSRKYEDNFAEKLFMILPKLVSLKKLSFCNARMTAIGATHLASALLKCSCITEINLSGNNLGDDGTKLIIDILPKLPQLLFVNISKNNASLQAAVYLTKKISSMNVQRIYIDGSNGELKLTFDPNCGRNSHEANLQTEISLLKHKWSRSEMQSFASSLTQYPSISVLNLSGGQWKIDTLKVLAHFLPNFNITEKTILNGCCSSFEAVIVLITLLSQCTSISKIHISLSYSLLDNDTIKNLVDILPKITSLKTLILNACITSTTEALLLVRGVTSCERVKSIQMSLQGESRIFFDKKKQDQFSFRFSHFSLDTGSLNSLLQTLQSGPPLSELDLSNNNLDVKSVVTFLPELKINNYVNLSNTDLKQQDIIDVVNTLCTCDNVSAVEVCLAVESKCILWFRRWKKQIKRLRITEAALTPNCQKELVKIISFCHRPIKLEMKNCFSGSVVHFVEMFDSSCAGCTVIIEEAWIRSEEAVRLLCHCLELNRNINSISIQQTTLHLVFNNSFGPTQYFVCGKASGPDFSATTTIGLVDCEVQGAHLALMKDTLQRCLYLTKLDFSHNCLGEIGAEMLCSVIPALPNLTSLRVDKDECVHFAQILCKSLSQCNSLQSLSLSGNVMNEFAAQVITNVLPRLKAINLSQCVWENSGELLLINNLAHYEHLEELCLDCLQLDQESEMSLTQTLPRVKTLRVLKLNNISTSLSVVKFLVAMKKLVHLEDLQMIGWKMLDSEIDQLVKLLPLWTRLQKICISRNNLGDLTAARMALVFPSLTHMCVVDISENNIGPKGSVELAKAISCLKNLTQINLTSVGTSELCAAVTGLTYCPQLQDVRLGWNKCGDDAAQALAKVLLVCQNLEKIDLECNFVSLVGAEALLEALHSCPALKIIRLWKNRVSPGDAEKLSQKDRRLSFSST
ncbi:hypothetical protein WMY93_023904 [Mugilogobius chulae]|uniref:NACHT domain-containing protein n=1 Tax=Mugilogobius chulae TaxID=88201 RepID=A0AAW0N6P8_9GOBI